MTHTEFPKLLWHGETNREITVHDKGEESARRAEGYQFLPIEATPVDPVMDLSQALAGLSDDEQAAILETQKKARMAAIAERLAGLSDADLDRVFNAKTNKRKKTA